MLNMYERESVKIVKMNFLYLQIEQQFIFIYKLPCIMKNVKLLRKNRAIHYNSLLHMYVHQNHITSYTYSLYTLMLPLIQALQLL